jgi:AraC-like DNA-binding protein
VNNAEGRHICIGISGRGVAALAPGVRHGCGELGWLFGRIAQAASSDSASKSERLDHLCALIALELRELAVSDASTPPLAPGRRAQAIIDDSFDTAHDVASLAKQVYLSPDYFRSVFKREVGQPVTKYLIGKRIDHARLLLTSTDTTVAQIAEECGFSSPYYFSRMFKKYSGISPAEFRKKGPSE